MLKRKSARRQPKLWNRSRGRRSRVAELGRDREEHGKTTRQKEPNVRSLSLLTVVIVCVGCGQEPATPSPEQQPTEEKKTVAVGTLPQANARGQTPQSNGHTKPPESEEAKTASKKSVTFNKTEYVHRWSQGDQHEFTPPGQEDLSKWTDMLTVNVYHDAVDGDGLALVANKVLGAYQNHKGTVVRTDSVPRTTEKPAEHLVVVVLGDPKFLEAVLARFVLVNNKGVAIIRSHRVYGSRAGPEMSEWLKADGPSMEKALMEWEPSIPVVTELLKKKGEQVGKAAKEAVGGTEAKK
jgi:hypothetical protein